jgi:hypothetical protein
MSDQRNLATAHWTTKAAAVLFCVFCLELGAFLIVFPWLDVYPSNWFIQARPEFRPLFTSYSFRGAMTGLGCLNVLVGIGEILRLRRFAVSSGAMESGSERPPAA